MNIRIIKGTIALDEVKKLAEEFYFPMIKGVADIENEIIALGGEYHNDANLLLQKEEKSLPQNIWGFNIHTDKPREIWLEYNSLINIRPAVGNRTMDLENDEIKNKIKKIIDSKII